MSQYPYSSSVGYMQREGPQIPRPRAPRVPRPRVPAAPRAKAPAVFDPFAPLTPGQITSQASAAVNAQIQPLIKQLQDLFAQRNAQGSQAITDYTSKLAALVAPLAAQTGQIYADAQSKQQALDATLKSNLTSGGQADANALTSQLSAAGQNTAPVAQVASAGASAGATRYALGSASLAQLIAQGANAQSYMAKQPGIEAATGRQNMRDFQAQLNNQLAQQVGDLNSKIPGLVQGEIQSLQNRELSKSLARASGLTATAKAKASADNTAFNQWYKTATLKDREAYQAEVISLRKQGLSDAEARRQAQATAKATSAQNKAVGKRDSAFNSARKNAYAKAQSLANQTNPVTGLKTRANDKTVYRYLWNVYGRPLAGYTSQTGRAGWIRKIDAMIRTAMLTAGYPAPATPYVPPIQ